MTVIGGSMTQSPVASHGTFGGSNENVQPGS
jgi:hypothetical protein